jgi:hypothetical protein
MNVQFPYRAIICGEEHIVNSWRGRKLITDKGNYLVNHIYSKWQIENHRLLEIATIRSDGNSGWLVNDKPLAFLKKLSMGARLHLIPNDENLRVHKDKICAVAWFDTAGNSPKVTEILDEIKTFWEKSSLALIKNTEEPSVSKVLEVFGNGLLDLFKYKELFPTWSNQVWLKEFRLSNQKKVISADEKRLVAVTTELEKTKKRLSEAEIVANLTLKEALSNWMRFEPPNMSADTKARIEKAVRLYLTEPEKRSLAKIAAEFKVTRKTVSDWFKKFTHETRFRVVTYTRHESVKMQLQSAALETDEDE